MIDKTALHSNHLKHGAKMGEFAGYDMPLYYELGVMKEHEWVRESCGLFDVSHMGQAMIEGPGTLDFVHKIVPSDFSKLPEGQTKYTVLTNEQGGIIDDLMITHAGPDHYHLVINAGCKYKDMDWIKKHLPSSLKFTYFEDWALLALQGPKAEEVLKSVVGMDAADMPYMAMRPFEDMFVSRLGYTGEDGFEIAVHNDKAPALFEKLLAHPAVKPIGLAARDSLRLEMGYALYGHDIDDKTSPVEASMNWILSKERDGYFGSARIRKEQAEGPSKKFVGIKLLEPGVAREGAEIRNGSDQKIGVLTGGGFSPTLKASIGQGYVTPDLAAVGTKLFVNVRGKNIAAEVVRLPHVAAKTKSAKKKEAA
ncbi:MAG: glycine cleavage system aminomethyltransferase GcvT [Alphaproteobacteria bacterium]|nr:glycine cleavage system aminomethyltransferase GcvT [Alphaproteobacteria bacterium]